MNNNEILIIERKIKNIIVLEKIKKYIRDLREKTRLNIIVDIRQWISEVKKNPEFNQDKFLDYLVDKRLSNGRVYCGFSYYIYESESIQTQEGNTYRYHPVESVFLARIKDFNDGKCKTLNLFVDFLEKIMI